MCENMNTQLTRCAKSSKNFQNHFFTDLFVASNKSVRILLKCVGYQRRNDGTYETVVNNAVITESLYRSFGQSLGGAEYE